MTSVELQRYEEREADSNRRDMRESQRALELRKFFAPNSFSTTSTDRGFNDSLNNDGALDAYAETVVWRLDGVQAMVSLIDRGTQYFLAGCIRSSRGHSRIMNTDEWFGCSTVPVPGGLCENTLSVDMEKDQYPCFIVHDLSEDPRFSHLPVVDGTMASYRFYAGTPITTSNGVNIGSFFLFDDRRRPHGLLQHEKQFIHQQAANVMKHLETKREAAERRRVALMSQGIAKFLERGSHGADVSVVAPKPLANAVPSSFIRGSDSTSANAYHERSDSESKNSDSEPETSILDKIRVTLDRAAEILRESLELKNGGVVFFDTAVGFTNIESINAYTDKSMEIGATMQEFIQHEERLEANGKQTVSEENQKLARKLLKRTNRTSSDKYKTSKVLAMSVAGNASWDPDTHILDTKTLQTFVGSYPKGHIWYIDEEGYFSSLEQVSTMEPSISPAGRRQSIDLTKQHAEANMLSRVFHKARQIVFLPLWDAPGDRWHSGCFLWSQSAVPVFTTESEISYLSAFTNSLMVEISRLDAITSNKMKSDFISSISHEFRSPLHGILASAEFLRETEPSGTQLELISTIQNCGGTLLDTINHVLDYSKINSFEKSGNQQGTISNELYQTTNVALLCEDIVNGMIAANEYRRTGDPSMPVSNGATLPNTIQDQQKRLDIILDFENRDWEYNIQPGALRRVVMNIFGNAQKYTDSGHILVQLRMLHDPDSKIETISLRIRDSGRGMSSEYMERKLYHPFAQEDTFAPGVGLGLSIVWSILNQLGGKISIRSQLGKGTDVEITLPVERVKENSNQSQHGDLMKVTQEAEDCVKIICKRAIGQSVRISRSNSVMSSQQAVTWDCIEKYCSDWFGFKMKSSETSILITDTDEILTSSGSERVLVVHDQILYPAKLGEGNSPIAIETICQPIGPFRLARCLLALMDQDLSERATKMGNRRSDHSTQTPLGSPEERAVLNGIITNDYGFQGPTSATPMDCFSEPKSTSDSSISKESGLHQGPQQRATVDFSSSLNLTLPPSRKPIHSPLTNTTSSPKFSPLDLPIRNKIASAPASTSLRILAVDDNDVNLHLIQRFLHKRKSDIIVTARNGVEAVEAVRKVGTENTFDVIFMDISMPEMNGFEATRLIRAYERSQTPVSNSDIFGQVDVDGSSATETERISRTAVEVGRRKSYIVALTGLASRRDRDEADESGFDDFLTKPISFVKIGELLKRLSEEKRRGAAVGALGL